MIRTETKNIDGRTIHVTTLGAIAASKLGVRLTKILGPGLFRMLSGAPGVAAKGLKADIDLSTVGSGVEALLDRLGENDLEPIVRLLFETAKLEKDGQTMPFLAVFDLEYAGDLAGLGKALVFALEVNYGNFFGGLRSRLEQALAKNQPVKGSPSP
jgi:hypothetical protein